MAESTCWKEFDDVLKSEQAYVLGRRGHLHKRSKNKIDSDESEHYELPYPYRAHDDPNADGTMLEFGDAPGAPDPVSQAEWPSTDTEWLKVGRLPSQPQDIQTVLNDAAERGPVGLALSGGGIRSATFSLGLLQGLVAAKVFHYVDYLSTVSGGGYIGCCLSALLTDKNAGVEPDNFPFRYDRKRSSEERAEVKHLRRYSKYMTPGRGAASMDGMRIAATFFSGLLLTSLLPLGVIFLLAPLLYSLVEAYPDPMGLYLVAFWILAITLGALALARWAISARESDLKRRVENEQGLGQMLFAATAALGFCLLLLATHAVTKDVSAQARISALRLDGAVTLAVTQDVSAQPEPEKSPKPRLDGAVTLAVTKVVSIEPKKSPKSWLNGVSVMSLGGLLLGLIRTENPWAKRVVGIGFKIALTLVLPVVVLLIVRFLWLYDGGVLINCTWPVWGTDVPAVALVGVGLLLWSCLVNYNRVSLHHMYRDRLSRAYVFKGNEKPDDDGDLPPNEEIHLSDLHNQPNGAPYHLINCTLNIPSTRLPTCRGRGADAFIFSKNYCGSEATKYRETDQYNRKLFGAKGKNTRLATVLAISGAAVSPQYFTSSLPALRMMMVLLNARLNRWMPNPKYSWTFRLLGILYLIKELLGRGSESDRWVNLADGGFHENLGLYQLLKRKCRFIIASDAGSDPDFEMSDLGRALRQARIDLGVNVTFQGLDQLRPNATSGYSCARWAPARIQYHDGTHGLLVYIKTAVKATDAEDIRVYKRQNPDFPDQTTADQFFDEAQFESYRKLGETAAREIFKV